jgi:hypothetical protein
MSNPVLYTLKTKDIIYPVAGNPGKNRKIILLSFIILIFNSFINTTSAQAPVDPSSIIGKVVCGYQGWFTCTGDGSPINQWTHWAPGNTPQPGVAPNPNPNLTFDVYPDVSMYQSTSLFQTNFANQGDGQPAKLFSDYKQDVTDKHFQLMQANGVDGVAFQRFIWEVLVDPRFKANRDTDEVHVRAAAEKYQRMFYLVYDLSGLGNVPATSDQVRLDSVQGDWQNNMIDKLHITSSPMYAKQGGKPVVQIWGIGYSHIIGTVTQQQNLINWFKAQGCYVIIGVPIDWHKLGNTGSPGGVPAKANWTTAYLAGNMVSPWAVGAYSDQTSTDAYKTNYLTPDLSYCTTNGMAYQPVIFPGFSWYNWNSGTQNQIPRNKGNFLWHQAYNLRLLNIKTAEIAMMDEYDEGTAILPMADSYFKIPTNQYFVTSSADGTYLSSDFYIRLAYNVTRQINQLDAANVNMPIQYSVGPIYFRTSSEALYDAQPTWVSTTDVALAGIKQYGNVAGTPTCATILATPHSGQYSLKVMGYDNSGTTSNVYFKVYDVNIAVTTTTDLSFWTYPLDALGRFISVDLDMTDGTKLSTTAGAVDNNSISMKPSAGRGTINTWTQTKSNIGLWLNGKTIDKIIVAYDNNPLTGNFSGYIDDISINETSYSVLPVKLSSFTAEVLKNDVKVQWQTSEENSVKEYEIQRSADGIHFNDAGIIFPSLFDNQPNKNYRFSDTNAVINYNKAGHLYYRLKTTGEDGDFTYSSIQAVSFATKNTFIVNLYPNPFTNKIDVTVNSGGDNYLNAVITGIKGEALVDTKIKVSKGFSNVSIPNLERLAKGIYFLELSMDKEKVTYKIEK